MMVMQISADFAKDLARAQFGCLGL